MKKFRLVLLWTLVIINILIIFSFSMQSGNDSSNTTSNALEVLTKIDFINKLSSNPNIDLVLIIRKLAHFSEYFILGVLLNIAIFYSITYYRYKYIFVISIGILVACIDETIQYFNKGREARLFDVMIDSLGILFSIGIFMIFVVVKRKINHKKIESI